MRTLEVVDPTDDFQTEAERLKVEYFEVTGEEVGNIMGSPAEIVASVLSRSIEAARRQQAEEQSITADAA